MQKIERAAAKKYAFDWRDAPALRVQCGESFQVETWDASGGYFRSEADKANPALRKGFDQTPPLANPVAGPVFVQGAEPGDTLAIEIESIEVGDFSWTASGPARGPLGDSAKWSDLSCDYTTKILKHEPGPSGTMRDGVVHFNQRIKWNVAPFIGTIALAPQREVLTSYDGQGAWGGNVDVRDVAPGHRILLPVYHEGGLLYLGDVHASQGDGEFTGAAAETCSTLHLKANVIKAVRHDCMRIEKPGSIVAVHAARPLELAVEVATIHLMQWLVDEFNFSQTDAYFLLTTCPGFRLNVYQSVRMARLNGVVGAEIERKYL